MDFSGFDPENSLIITASRRQSRFIRERYAAYQFASGYEVWPSIKVMPWSAFVDYCWGLALDAGATLPTRLGSEQCQYLWQRLVSSSEAVESLLNTKQTQHLSFDAWRICQQWQIRELEVMPGDQDQEIFADWLKQFKHQLDDSGWIDSHQQANVLLDHVTLFALELPQNMLTYGFEQPTPQQQSLLSKLGESKSLTEWSLMAKAEVEVKLYSLAEPEDELLAAVRWAKDKLQKDEHLNLAIVVPDLEQKRGVIERIIYREFYAKNLSEGDEVTHPLHDFSIDEALLKQPQVAVVMDYFTFYHRSITKSQLQHLLLSPYLYHEQQQHWSATKFELLIRKSTKQYYSQEDLLKLTRFHQVDLPWLKTMELSQKETPQSTDLKEHIKFVLESLATLHWTGYHSLSSREYQVQQTFIEAIKSTEKLQKVLAKSMTFGTAVQLLKEQLELQNFHQQQPKAPLQVMGLLEAIGVTHDAVWLVGATDQALPQKATPNPFLSKTLHQKHELPGSSHKRELEYAGSLLRSLLANPELVISYAEYDGEQEQMISPLLQHLLPEHHVERLYLEATLPWGFEDKPNSQSLEYFTDHQGLPLESHYAVKGGTGLLRMQAASPFDAYLRYRLNIEPFEVDGVGVSFMDRGNLFHQVMQLIWERLKSQSALLELSPADQSELVDSTTQFVLSEAARKIYLLQNASFFTIEKARLEALVTESLELDKKRTPFKVVATETSRQVELAGLTFSIIIDRIDELEDGSKLIIDYKTGQPTLVSLFRDPVAEPQLLLYAISERQLNHEAGEHEVAGIVFMQAHLKECKYIGITNESDVLEGVKALKDIKNNPYADSFNEAINEWKVMLEVIAEDFKKGNAELTEYSGNFAEHLAVSRWSQRELDLEALVNSNNVGEG
ncbi:PD-(D/E)XK nuclease family protein [Kangiella taiwanensis]|uniref:PD-(D/E)XK nuclease family protein n=1 Tax=Kangiella taiwanensis TaxID=1079179 RepID=A0ABP8I2L5_9GAMM|nr:PD-(D/E)XK nuclease family protein [Kangiella taiwanensis]